MLADRVRVTSGVESSIDISELAIGGKVSIKINNEEHNFIKVHQGKPSSRYDDNSEGTWLLMEEIHNLSVWTNNYSNPSYYDSDIKQYLDGAFLEGIEGGVRDVIFNTSLASPYRYKRFQVFVLSFTEVGLDANETPSIYDGSLLSYFYSGNSSYANGRRVANYNGTPREWWTRTYSSYPSNAKYTVKDDGGVGQRSMGATLGVRPAFIIPNEIKISKSKNSQGVHKVIA